MATVLSVKTNVKVTEKDYAIFKATLDVFALVFKKDMASVVKEQAMLLCGDMVDFTPPFSGASPAITKGGEGGFGNRARKKGMDSVSRDIRKIFAPIEQATAATVAKSGDMEDFTVWMKRKRNLPAPHYPGYLFDMYDKQGAWMTVETLYGKFKQVEQNKSAQEGRFNPQVTEGWIKTNHYARRGGAPGSNALYKVSEGVKKDKLYVYPFQAVESYIKKVQRRVGRLKSGWYAAYKAQGGKKQSQWIAAQGTGEMIYIPQLSGDKPQITVGNKIGRNFRQSWRFFDMAMSHRAYSMRVRIFHKLKGARYHGTLMEVARRLQGGFEITQE